ncbi:MAG: hypothetical protein WCV80_00070 [Candidatus Paceibacterota bacterium]
MKKTKLLILIALLASMSLVGGILYLKNKNNSDTKERVSRPAISKLPPGVVKYVNAKGEEWTILEKKVDLRASSGSGFPKTNRIVIDPLDVKVGDIQKMNLVAQGDIPIVRAWAEIETDNSIKIVDLTLTTSTFVSMAGVLKEPYLVDEKGQLVINNGETDSAFQKLTRTAEAQVPIIQYEYEGSWKVVDTHTRTYHTKFVVRDSSGREDSSLIAWSDPTCDFGSDGVLVTASCTPASGEIIGFDGANMSLGAGSKIITLSGTGSMIAYNGGASGGVFIPSGSKILINGTGASIKQTNLYYADSDTDGYLTTSQVFENTAASWANHTRLKDVANKGTTSNYQTPSAAYTDCDDSSANTHPGQTSYFTTAITGGGPKNGTFDYNCDGVSVDTITVDTQYHDVFAYTKGAQASPCYWTGSACVDAGNVPSNGWAHEWYSGNRTTAPNCGNIGLSGYNGVAAPYSTGIPGGGCGNYTGAGQTICNLVGTTNLIQSCR